MYDTMLKLKKGITLALFVIAGVLLAAMALLVIIQVFTRYVLSDPADWTEELVTVSLMWACFLCGAYAFVNRKHMALVFFRDRLPEAGKRIVMILVDALALAFAAIVIVWGGTQLTLISLDAPSAILQIPRGLSYGAAPVGGLFMVLAQIINLWEDFTGETLPDTDLGADDETLAAEAAADIRTETKEARA